MYLDEPYGLPYEAFVPQLLSEGGDVMVSREKVRVEVLEFTACEACLYMGCI